MLLLVLGLMACNVKKDPSAVITRQLNDAENIVRFSLWEHFPGIQSPEYQAHVMDLDFLSTITVTEVVRLGLNIELKESDEGQHKATATYQVKFYQVDSVVNKTLTYVQKWIFNEKKQRWEVASDLPDFAGFIEKYAAKKRKVKENTQPKIKVMELPSRF